MSGNPTLRLPNFMQFYVLRCETQKIYFKFRDALSRIVLSESRKFVS